jgi:hypothetical protein
MVNPRDSHTLLDPMQHPPHPHCVPLYTAQGTLVPLSFTKEYPSGPTTEHLVFPDAEVATAKAISASPLPLQQVAAPPQPPKSAAIDAADQEVAAADALSSLPTPGESFTALDARNLN